MSVVYLSMDSPVTGWITGAQKCVVSMSGGIVSAAMAALEYSLGVIRANRGERRGVGGVSDVVVGTSIGGHGAREGCVGAAVGVTVGGMLARVCRPWRRGAARATRGVVGLVDVGWCTAVSGVTSPFEVGHGSVSSSYGPVEGAPFLVSVWRASMIVRKRVRRLCCGSCSIPRRSSRRLIYGYIYYSRLRRFACTLVCTV